MEIILLAIILAFIITYTAIPVIINVSNIKKLYDLPNARKVHATPVPSLGGLGIFAGFMLSCLLSMSFSDFPAFQYFFAAALVIFFLGLKDDILILTPMKKIIGQVIAAFIIIYKGGVVIGSMHGFGGINELPEVISLIITYLTVIVIINSFNLIDGVDGLAAGLGIFTTLTFGVYFYIIGHIEYAALAFAMCGSLLAFLIFNRSPARIFMGDTGSLLIGLVNAILVVHFINVASNPVSAFPLQSTPAIGIAILIIPLFDTLRVFSIRIVNRRSPFSPDRNHIHHILLDRGMSHKMVCFTLIMANIVFVLIAYSLRSFGNNIVIPVLLATAFGAFAFVYYMRNPKLKVVKGFNEKDIVPSSRILPINPSTKTAEHN
ncbi:MAG: undecaprenyl/decaprenyl-phosphate alpha-N-acetylglucosaminyl 1-phosphate transferase [Chitinophagaceae bacterium]|nr:undecaprenyl/decaprenyl-phosphate alpha-N-acetylglucosaminyl 1-phosphate transferase [Chitinophagaceae bacterium]MCW5925679.1 undecaprenyl/decaprenyl-phosphate alpha-N-acetylglucosaminyl 1-phosphate transferase [Chitinophagaceae bacterium]